MNRKFFNTQFAALVNAYTIAQKLSDESQDVYWEMLKDIPEDKFAVGVKECLGHCKFFPTIAELGAASLPPIRDKMAPLPPIDHPWPTIDWREQLRRADKIRTKAIDQPRQQLKVTPDAPPDYRIDPRTEIQKIIEGLVSRRGGH